MRRWLIILLAVFTAGCQPYGFAPPGFVHGPQVCPKDLPPDSACASR